MDPTFGKYIMLAGAALLFIGAVAFFLGDKLNWLGRLPGDIRVERENFTFYFPITTMILFSLFLTLALRLVRKFF